MIAQLIDGSHRDWDKWLPEIGFAYNSARHDSTGYSPAYLNYGREPATPGALHQSTTDITEEDDGDQHDGRAEALDRLQEAIRIARHAQAQATEVQKKTYNLRRRDWRPRIGESVMLREHPLSSAEKSFATKLAPPSSLTPPGPDGDRTSHALHQHQPPANHGASLAFFPRSPGAAHRPPGTARGIEIPCAHPRWVHGIQGTAEAAAPGPVRPLAPAVRQARQCLADYF